MDGTALVLALQGVIDFDVDLRTVEGAIAWVKFPWLAELVEGVLESLLSFVPELLAAEHLLRSSRELKFKLKVEEAVDVLKEVQHSQDLVHNLVRHAEVMAVVLLEPPHTSQA